MLIYCEAIARMRRRAEAVVLVAAASSSLTQRGAAPPTPLESEYFWDDNKDKVSEAMSASERQRLSKSMSYMAATR